MSTIPQQIQQLRNDNVSLRALVNGVRDPGLMYAIFGDYVIFGCKITQGTSSAHRFVALDGQATGDSARLNPDIETPAVRTEEYPNIALVYGIPFLSANINKTGTENDSLLVADPPATTGHGRHDIVYCYTGPGVSIATGASSTAVKTAFDGTGLSTAPYPATHDPVLPRGAFALARIYVQTGDTGVATARIADIRHFTTRFL